MVGRRSGRCIAAWPAGVSCLVVVISTSFASAQPPAAMPPATSPVQVGVAAAVGGTVELTSTGAVGRIAQSGQPVFLGDVVKTDADGHLQILLLDQTVFTIGPHSALVIDEFIYDPATSDGRVAARVVKGAFRFVTGKIAHKEPKNMTVALPTGTIGVRGTMVAGRVDDAHAMVVLLGPGPENNAGARIGRIEVGNDIGSVMVTRPGFGTELTRPDVPPTPSAPVPEAQLQALAHELTAPPASRPDRQPHERTPDGQKPQGPAQQNDSTETQDSDGKSTAARPTHLRGPGMMPHHGPEGEGGNPLMMGPPTVEGLQAAADAGYLTTEQLHEMTTDLEAWNNGDPTVRAALLEKYGGPPENPMGFEGDMGFPAGEMPGDYQYQDPSSFNGSEGEFYEGDYFNTPLPDDSSYDSYYADYGYIDSTVDPTTFFNDPYYQQQYQETTTAAQTRAYFKTSC